METLKNAATNVWQIANLASITIRPYVLTRPPQLELFSSVELLRRAGSLCWLDHEALLIFGLGTEPKEQELQEPGLSALDKLSWDQIQGLDEQKQLLGKLSAAIAAQISQPLLEAHQLHLIDKTIWAHQALNDDSDRSLLLRLHLRAASGTLYLVLNHEAMFDNVLRQATTALPLQVVLAPTGTNAEVLGKNASSDRLGQPPDKTWKAIVLAMLRSYIIDIDYICDWTLVRVVGKDFWWPSTMCFGLNEDSNTPALTDDATVSPTDHLDGMETLSFAEAWLMSSEQRKVEIKDEQLRQLQSDTNDHIDTAHSQFDLATAVSPPFVNRPDLMHSLNVYPTPPDGMNIVALPRSTASDSTMQLAATANEHDANALFHTQTHDVDMLLDTRERGPSIASSVGQPFRQSMNDLFGEADAELGSAEIGDHDFDFFDEQDDVVMEDHVTSCNDESPPLMDLEPTALVDLGRSPVPADSRISTMQIATEPRVESTLELASSTAQLSPAKQHVIVDSYKPLSPFDVRERLLPPPIPASMATQGVEKSSKRRSSTFEPLVFNNSYRAQLHTAASDLAASPNRAYAVSPAALQREDSGSQEDISDAVSDEDEPLHPMILPWQSHHGQRHGRNASDRLVSWEVKKEPSAQESSSTMIMDLLQELLGASASEAALANYDHNLGSDGRVMMSRLLDLSSLNAGELINVVQICAQQSISCIEGMLISKHDSAYRTAIDSAGFALLDAIAATVSALSQTCTPCDINSIALVKETVRPSLAALKRQPGTAPKPDVTKCPDIQHVPAPYMRFNRADFGLELLPSAVDFWEELNLSPYTGSKDIALFCVGLPGLQDNLGFTTFIESLTAAFEGTKLGSVHVGDLVKRRQLADTVPHFFSLADLSVGDIDYDPRIYDSACARLAESLSESPPSRTVVILMIEHPADTSPQRTICASFHALQQMLKEQSVAKPALRSMKLRLQTVPHALFEQENLLTVLSSQSMAMLAREIYDRCPASSEKLVAPLPLLASPATILADTLPKRIGLQLTPSPPSDLLNENSELHVAFSTSADAQWMAVCWLDSTGWSQQTSVFSLSDQEMLKVIAEILQRTITIMATKDISWRVVITTDDALSNKQAQLWRHVVAAIQRLRRVLTVSLLALDCSPMLTLVSSDSLPSSASAGGPNAFLTPVSTPQGTSFPFSPEASAQGTPSTPIPSETVSELEGEVSLVDYADETWRILLKPELNLSSAQYADKPIPMASAVICKQGQSRGQVAHHLPLVAVDLIWIVRIRAGAGGVEALNVKSAEHMLRDSLTTFRGLAVLAKVRGLARTGEDCVPLHVLCARRGVSSVEGF